ncbi:MAG: hypothetical protein UDG86_10310 [Lachnospiraceae bacterium]|nr:hypothetical protein [Lachnospiraceae bacterium]
MRIELTEMSKRNLNFMTGQNKAPGQIVQFLKEEALVRSFSETLRRICPGKEILGQITDVLTEASGDKRENVTRKVRNWLEDVHVPKNREILFQICFALGAKEEDADRILGMGAENGIHYRNPKELVYAFGLRKGMGYQEAAALYRRVKNMLEDVPGDEQIHTETFTTVIRQEFQEVCSVEELIEFFLRNRTRFGELHNTAHGIYVDLLKKLQNPETGVEEDEGKYNVDKVLENYLRMKVPNSRKTEEFTLLQRVVKKYWPNQRSIIRMKKRGEDISRKTLILLQLVTEDFDHGDEEEFMGALGQSVQEAADLRLESRFVKMNLLLDRCGMSKLDPCCPFDYLVLYAMKAQEDENMGERMNEVVKVLFSEGDCTE